MIGGFANSGQLFPFPFIALLTHSCHSTALIPAYGLVAQSVRVLNECYISYNNKCEAVSSTQLPISSPINPVPMSLATELALYYGLPSPTRTVEGPFISWLVS